MEGKMEKWMLVAGCDMITEGSKQSCIDEYKSYPNPLPMRLLYITGEFEILRNKQNFNRSVIVGKIQK